MIDTRQLLDKIELIPQDDTLYLVDKLPCGTGMFVCNGNILYLVPNTENCDSLGIRTDFLHLETNVYVSAFNTTVSSFENGYYNYVELLLAKMHEPEADLSAFINLCMAHASYMAGREFIPFFDSLVSLFQLPKEQNYKNLIGLMGELLFIEFMYNEHGVDLSPFWHSEGSASKLDFVCPRVSFEVKTTANDSMCFTIKHNQLFDTSGEVYLVAASINEDNAGRTLDSVISSLLENTEYCNSLQFAENIEKEKRRISPVEMKTKRFSLKRINAYNTKDTNPFVVIPDCVEDLSYRLNLLPFLCTDISNITILPK